MNHDIKAQLSGEIELLLKKTGLPRFISAVSYVCFDLLFDLTLQRASEHLHVLPFCSFDTWQTMIIQTCLANRDHARTVRQLAQRRHDVVLGFFGIHWVDTNYRVNVRISLGKIHRAAAALD